MSGMETNESQKSQAERRQPGGSRVPFEALVEIAAPEGAAFEAESVDLSTSGMHLRTAYLPKIGAPLSFRFEAASGGEAVLATGEVVWAADGEFGVRFVEMEPGDAKAIREIVGVDANGKLAAIKPGSSVRIHIDGVSNPMRATMRDEAGAKATVGSELKMLRIGAVVELEDKEHRTRKTARIDSVGCEIDPNSQVPQLVVRLRYEGAAAETVDHAPSVPSASSAHDDGARTDRTGGEDAHAELSSPSTRGREQARPALPVANDGSRLAMIGERMKGVGDTMKIAFAGATSVAGKLGSRAKTTIALLGKREASDGQQAGLGDEARRVTAPPPASRAKARALRPQAGNGMTGEEAEMQEIDSKKLARRKQIGIAAGVGVVLMLGIFAFKKPAAHPNTTTAASAPLPELAPASASAPAVPAAPPVADSALATAASAAPAAALVGDSTGVDAKGNPNPFGNSSVKHGTRMVLKLDGPVAEIRGMQMPNGFTVSVPNRKSLEAASPLAAKDTRISSAKVQNIAAGAELTIAFKDTPPSYVVRAKGDSLEIILSHDKAMAKKGKNKGKDGVPAAKGAKHK